MSGWVTEAGKRRARESHAATHHQEWPRLQTCSEALYRISPSQASALPTTHRPTHNYLIGATGLLRFAVHSMLKEVFSILI